MDLSQTRVVIRERALLDVLDLAVRFVVENAGVYARTAALVLPPFFAASVLLGRASGAWAAWAFSLLVGAFAAAPFTALASRLVFDADARATSAVATALRALPRLFALRLATAVGGYVGLAFLVLPGLWALAGSWFAVEVLLLERAPVIVAFRRSGALVRRESGEAILAMILLGALVPAAVVAAEEGGQALVTVLLQSRAPAALWSAGWSWLALAGFWLFVPYAATARFLVYLDVRTRSEGWDVQTRFVALASRPSTDARSAA